MCIYLHHCPSIILLCPTQQNLFNMIPSECLSLCLSKVSVCKCLQDIVLCNPSQPYAIRCNPGSINLAATLAFRFLQEFPCFPTLTMHIFIFSVPLKYVNILICFISLAVTLRCLVCAGSCHTSLSLEMGKQDHGQSSTEVLQTARIFCFQHFSVRVLSS